MIQRIIHSSMASQLARYASRGGTLSLVGGTLPLDTPPVEVARILNETIALNGKCHSDHQVVHVVLSPTAKDRPLAVAEWAMIAQDAMANMGLQDCPYALYIHEEAGKIVHAHIATTQIDSAGRRIDMQGERYKAKRSARSIEKSYGLHRVSNLKNQPILPPINVPAVPLAGTLEPAGRVGGLGFDVNVHVKDALRDLVKPGVTLGDLAEQLALRGIEMAPNWQSAQTRIGGMVYRVGGSHVKASEVDASLKNLATEGVSYDAARDIPAILAVQNRFKSPAITRSPEVSHVAVPQAQLQRLPSLTPRQRVEQSVRGLGIPALLVNSGNPRLRQGRVPAAGRHSLR